MKGAEKQTLTRWILVVCKKPWIQIQCCTLHPDRYFAVYLLFFWPSLCVCCESYRRPERRFMLLRPVRQAFWPKRLLCLARLPCRGNRYSASVRLTQIRDTVIRNSGNPVLAQPSVAFPNCSAFTSEKRKRKYSVLSQHCISHWCAYLRRNLTRRRCEITLSTQT